MCLKIPLNGSEIEQNYCCFPKKNLTICSLQFFLGFFCVFVFFLVGEITNCINAAGATAGSALDQH